MLGPTGRAKPYEGSGGPPVQAWILKSPGRPAARAPQPVGNNGLRHRRPGRFLSSAQVAASIHPHTELYWRYVNFTDHNGQPRFWVRRRCGTRSQDFSWWALPS